MLSGSSDLSFPGPPSRHKLSKCLKFEAEPLVRGGVHIFPGGVWVGQSSRDKG